MFLRWTVCRVADRERDSFAQTQALGTRGRPSSGFLGQVGGWEQQDSQQACLATFWRDENAFLRSMTLVGDAEAGEPHDQTYLALSMESFEHLLEIPAQSQEMGDALWRATCLTVTEYWVRKGRVPHFLSMQRRVWRPGSQLVPGHLFGLLFKDQSLPHRFLSVHFWEQPEQVQEYRQDKALVLMELSQLEQDVESQSQHLILLEPRWFLKAEE